ncbi:Cof-type HAD-IIB family hydrolase [Catenisphaera adipataccumulans]|jgi:Cof subfamily protein (haloacid dehalogenase superfamily)|uniref:Cof-type HAD-IIB family hydrolase n=1 Tax=Catenisphaera adipataccumulans TaxID=700500 RepID=A0A7W8D0B5_9FIRM|nr:Cof-type HAD-IIB family hydrolase [Catenisphaera adipataccumulans]MBB5183649.1 hypothetical protein [Catenisphaera adipataccumulans]
MIKIIFFDIDGTLLPLAERKIHPPVVRALQKLHEKGILLFLATGRPPYVVPKFPEIEFDGAMCFNGQYCFNRKETVFSQPLDPRDICRVIDNAKALNKPVQLASMNRMGCNFFDKDLDEYFWIAGQKMKVVDDYEALFHEGIYQMMVPGTAEHDPQLLKGCPTLKAARWWDRATDIINKNSGKSIGMRHILHYYGIRQDECMAFGDGGNDVDMLEYAGIGIAMGNAFDSTKACADYITDDVKKDGVYTALKKFQLI